MESVRSSFHTQLATVMDSLLAAAVCEIAKIFENSLCEQQAELIEKTEELSIIRDKLEKAEKKQKVEDGAGEEETTSRIEEYIPDQDTQPMVASAELVKSLNQGVSRLKEETASHEETSIKQECVGSNSTQESLMANQSQINDPLSIQNKFKSVSNWDQCGHNADHRPIPNRVTTPLLSISQSGHCSIRSDSYPLKPVEWSPGQTTNQNGLSDLENLQTNKDGSSASANVNTDLQTSCFQPSFGSDETSTDDEDNSFSFTNQTPKKQNSGQNSVPSQEMQLMVTQLDHSETPSDVLEWRTRNDETVRETISPPRRVINLGRDPLWLQSNPQSLALRPVNILGNSSALTGGNGRPYACPYCTKCFTYPSHHRRHLLRHTGVRPHSCQFCNKSFLTPSELTVHTRTHTGERPFGCAQCGRRFARSGNLRAHQRDVHMRKRPFACSECGKRFAHKGNLRVHNHRIHQGDSYYIEDQPEPDIRINPS